MGLIDLLKQIFGGGEEGARRRARRRNGLTEPPDRFDLDELAGRLEMDVGQLYGAPIGYSQFTVPKRGGDRRTIHAPISSLKYLQRKVLRRILGGLRSHPAAKGFERGESIVTNARAHVGACVVLRMDVRDFFPSTTAPRVEAYFVNIGWTADAAAMLTKLCTHNGALPQGAPTSPRLSNVVNFALDARMASLAMHVGAFYTRYADDMTFSFRVDNRAAIGAAIKATKAICADYGYRLHQDRKLIIRRRHQCQRVTGLVVNDDVALPRATRRRLRAAAHRLTNGGEATLTEEQLAGWDALQHMIDLQKDFAVG